VPGVVIGAGLILRAIVGNALDDNLGVIAPGQGSLRVSPIALRLRKVLGRAILPGVLRHGIGLRFVECFCPKLEVLKVIRLLGLLLHGYKMRRLVLAVGEPRQPEDASGVRRRGIGSEFSGHGALRGFRFVLPDPFHRQAALDNPQEFALQAARIVREKAIQQLVDGIQYYKDGTWYDMSEWVEEEETVSDRLIPVNNSIYDYIVVPSDTEKKFAEKLKRMKNVRLFIKLPGWFQGCNPSRAVQP
jgi:hypothetical protein